MFRTRILILLLIKKNTINLRRVVFTALLICCFLCSHAQQENLKGFEIEGHISGIDNGTKVFLYDIDGEITLDSAIAFQGNFIFRGHVDRPTICWVKCQNEPAATILVENTQMTFRSTINQMRLNAIVTGGKEQDLQNELTSAQYPFDKIFLAAYDSLTNKLFSDDDDKMRLIKIFNEAQTSSHDLYVAFGKRHPNSFLGIDIIYRNRQRIGKDTIKTLLSQLSGELRSTSKVQALMLFVNDQLAEKGKQFIDFDAKTLDGASFKLSSLRGQYIVLYFWSAGCGPCRLQNRKVSKEYDRTKDKITIVSFSIDKNKVNWLKASKADNIHWTNNVSDLEGENSTIKTQYNVQATPTSFLINKEGIIVDILTGYDEENFLTRLEKLMEQK